MPGWAAWVCWQEDRGRPRPKLTSPPAVPAARALPRATTPGDCQLPGAEGGHAPPGAVPRSAFAASPPSRFFELTPQEQTEQCLAKAIASSFVARSSVHLAAETEGKEKETEGK